MKQVKLTFWLIGFGCGIVITGITGALITLNISTNGVEQVVSSDGLENQATKQFVVENQEIHTTEEELQEIQKSDQQVETKIQQNDMESNQSVEVTDQEEIEQLCEVIIPNKVTASEICQILQECGVVEDGTELLAYIKERKQQTLLKSGKLILPIGGTYEEILEELVS